MLLGECWCWSLLRLWGLRRGYLLKRLALFNDFAKDVSSTFTTCIENETERNSCSALIALRCKISFFKLSVLFSSSIEHHRKYAFCFEESQQSPKVRYLKNIAHMWNLHILLNQSMVKQTRKNASVYHVLNTTLSVLELNTRAVLLVRLLN